MAKRRGARRGLGAGNTNSPLQLRAQIIVRPMRGLDDSGSSPKKMLYTMLGGSGSSPKKV
jgi:hypothetical protein